MFQSDLFSGKTFLITGGGSGLGKSMAKRLADLGASVVILGRRQEALDQTAAEIVALSGSPVQTITTDIRDPEAVERTVAELFETVPVDGLVNNAAASFIARTETLSHRAADSIFGATLHGTFYCTLAFGKEWIKRKQRGVVLSIVSPNAETGSPYVVPSAMSKAGVLAMTKSLAVEWGGRGIRFVAIAPGSFPTPGAWRRVVPRVDLALQFETNNPLKRPGRHDELADLAAFLLSDHASYINGECVTIDGGRWLKGAAGFAFLEAMTESDWDELRPRGARTAAEKS